jgi:hypothetical protein
MLLPTHSKITLSIICLGSLFFLVGGLRRSARNRESQLSVLAGLAGLLYMGLDVCWYFYIRFLQSHTIALAYYFAMHLWGGIAVGMFLYIVHKSAKTLLAVSAVLLALFNVFVVARNLAWATSFVSTGDGLFGGMLIASLVFWFDRPKKQSKSESTMPTLADERRRD